ncbi:hypothetical protein FSP39_023199 [Pinctada imbricata]|uniref:Uncharacterized protein n=1 Tax=Pinctada imbricata TaxID=66713 RepID=A0AA88XNM6_PINIB|nr:hypothetical protein FSP39_023199 [Pinctada imbricata]
MTTSAAALVMGPAPPSAASSDQVSMDFEITSVDDDILHTVEKLFNFGKTGAIAYDTIQDILGKAIQAERNHWKERLNSAMQEIERQHKILLNEQISLQNLVGMCGDDRIPSSRRDDKPETIQEETSQNESVSTEQLLENLKFKIAHLKQIAIAVQGKDSPTLRTRDPLKKYSDKDLRYMKNALAKIHFEKEALENKLLEREKEMKWLQHELDAVKSQLKKLQVIVKQYNSDHTGANFHLNEVAQMSPSSRGRMEKANTPMKRERTYIEGDQLQSYPVPSEEVAVWKLRLQSNIYSARKGNARTGITQCLRCHKLFKPTDNNSKSCKYHNKGREIKEQYDSNGRLLHVVYKWACCKKGLDSAGCTTGHHI